MSSDFGIILVSGYAYKNQLYDYSVRNRLITQLKQIWDIEPIFNLTKFCFSLLSRYPDLI